MAKTFAEAAAGVLTLATGSSERSTDKSSDNAHLAETLRLWRAMLPARGRDDISGELMLRGYMLMLGHLSAQQIDTLTNMVLNQCKFFPTVAEIRELMGRESYSNPFYVAARQSQLHALGYTSPQKAPRRVGGSGHRHALTDESSHS